MSSLVWEAFVEFTYVEYFACRMMMFAAVPLWRPLHGVSRCELR